MADNASDRPSGRALGLALGTKRVGVAVTDSDRTVATPLEVLARTGSRQQDHRAVSDLVDEWEIALVVVGMPYSLDGGLGPAARSAEAEVRELRATLSVPVETYDERFTTVTADRSLMEQGIGAADRRRMVDMVAASVLLQAWVDSIRAEASPSEEPDSRA